MDYKELNAEHRGVVINSKQTQMTKMTKRYNIIWYHSMWVIVTIMAVLMSAGPASGQIIAQPMKIRFTPFPGRLARTALKFENHSANESKTLDLTLVDLTQREDASTLIIEDGSDFDISKMSSCRQWINLSTETVEVGPLRTFPVVLTVKVPPDAHGFYAAGIIAEIRPRPGATGVGLIIRFLIPVTVEVQGRLVRHKIELTDVGMEFRQATAEDPTTTLASLSIENNGGTYSSLSGKALIRKLSGKYWRMISTAEFQDRNIIPGVKLNLKSDIGRSLPSGKYRVTGTLYVDGRRLKPLEKEITFSGDPSVTKAVTDAALNLQPLEVSIKNAQSGATRSAVIKIENASEDTINVTAALGLPPVLKNVAFGELKGEDLTCAEWVKMEPEKFTLRGGARRSIRIITKMPNSELTHARYYAHLSLRAKYLDGQSAGERTALVYVENKGVGGVLMARPMKLSIAAMEASKYIVVGRFGNLGNSHFTPKCRAMVRDLTTGATVARLLLSGKPGVMLPLEVRDFSGVVDFSRIIAGTYRLTAILEYAGEQILTEIPVRVSLGSNEQRLVEIVQPKEVEEQLGVKW
jgi:hypothetical protein